MPTRSVKAPITNDRDIRCCANVDLIDVDVIFLSAAMSTDNRQRALRHMYVVCVYITSVIVPVLNKQIFNYFTRMFNAVLVRNTADNEIGVSDCLHLEYKDLRV